MTNILTPKNAKKYICESCDFKCCKLCDYDRHINTRKHSILTNTNETTAKNAKTFECKCGKKYKHMSSLCGHKITCSIIQGTNNIDNKTNEFHLDKELLIKMLLKNQDVMKK